jgi:hypothetical protein
MSSNLPYPCSLSGPSGRRALPRLGILIRGLCATTSWFPVLCIQHIVADSHSIVAMTVVSSTDVSDRPAVSFAPLHYQRDTFQQTNYTSGITTLAMPRFSCERKGPESSCILYRPSGRADLQSGCLKNYHHLYTWTSLNQPSSSYGLHIINLHRYASLICDDYGPHISSSVLLVVRSRLWGHV